MPSEDIHTRAGEAAARLEKCGQSMSTSALSRIDAALCELVLIDGHVTRPQIWLVRLPLRVSSTDLIPCPVCNGSVCGRLGGP